MYMYVQATLPAPRSLLPASCFSPFAPCSLPLAPLFFAPRPFFRSFCLIFAQIFQYFALFNKV